MPNTNGTKGTKKNVGGAGLESASRVTRAKKTSAPKRARAAAAGAETVAVAETVTVAETVAVAETVTVAEAETVIEMVAEEPAIVLPLPAPAPETEAAMMPPVVEWAAPRHPWLGEPPARLIGRFLDGWRRRIERRVAAKLPWIARLVARYGPASMQQRKPVE